METEKLANHLETVDKQFIYKSPIRSIFDKFSREKDVSLIYGEPIALENKRVLPVARAKYNVGGGGGYSGKSDQSSADQGEGGGGFISVKPLGVYEVTPEKVKFKPIIDLNLVFVLFTVLTFGLVWVLRRR